MPGKHAQWSPSGSPYWYNDGAGCPARVQLPPKPESSSPAAAEGTRLHDLAEEHMRDSVTVSDEDWEKIGDYIKYVEGWSYDPKVNVTLEEKVNLAPITGEQDATGSVDALVCSDEYLEVIDLKTGAKIVEPTSSQLRMYAAAAVYELDYAGESVVCTIHQGGKAHSVTYKTDELMAFANEVRSYVHDCEQYLDDTGEAIHIPSENNCQWCPHVVDCTAVNDFKDKLAADDFVVAEDPEVIASDLGMVGALRRWCDEIESRALDMAGSGTQVPGYKLVRARTNRKWTPEAEDKLFALLGDAAYSKKLIGLTAADKLVDADTMNDLTTRPEGRPTLVELKDRRPAIDDAAADFKDA